MRFPIPIPLLLLLVLMSPLQPLLAEGRPAEPPAASVESVRRLEERVGELEALVYELLEELRTTRPAASQLPGSPRPAATAAEPVDPPVLRPAQVPSPQASDPSTMRVYWKEGLRMDSADERFQLKFGGRLHIDAASFSADRALEQQVGPLQDGFEFRRARLFVDGTLYDNVKYKAEYDFAGDVVDGIPEGAGFKDVYIGLESVPVLGSITVGHQKEPFSLEELNSSRFIVFQERASGNVFAPSRNTGITVQNQALGSRLNLAAGVFRSTDDKGNASGDGGYNFTARAAGTPHYADGGRQLVHLGFAWSHQNSFFERLRFRERPETHLAPRFVNTGVFAADDYQLFGFEGAVVAGPFSAQSEWVHNRVDAPSAGDPRFNSVYVQGSFFLTGENRRYSLDKATFDRVRPARDFFNGSGGTGAWEVAARYSRLDLTDALITGGVMNNLTLGLNWYLNPNTRWTFNYVFSDLDRRENANLFQMRFFVDF